MTVNWPQLGRRLLATTVIIGVLASAPVLAAGLDPEPTAPAAEAPAPLTEVTAPTAEQRFEAEPATAPESEPAAAPAAEPQAAVVAAARVAQVPKTVSAPDSPKPGVRTTVKPRRMQKIAPPKKAARTFANVKTRRLVRAPSSSGELAMARSILAGLIAQYPILRGATVTIGATPGGYQAVCFYQSGRIVINPNHRASLSSLLRHEVGHIIDWRDNGRIDWGENLAGKY